MALLEIPNELLLMIAEGLSIKDLSHLLSTNRHLSDLLTPRLHSLAIQDIGDLSGLHWAAIEGYGPLAELAISKGAEINQPCRWPYYPEYGRTPLDLAIIHDTPDVVRALVKKGAQIIHSSRSVTPIQLAARCGATRAIWVLLELCPAADMTQINWCGETPAHIAAKYGHVHTMAALLKAGFDISLQTSEGNTVLHCAYNKVETVKYLLAAGGAGIINVQNMYGNTILHLAIMDGYVKEDRDFIKLLVVNGADVEVKNKDGYTPLSLLWKAFYASVSVVDP